MNLAEIRKKAQKGKENLPVPSSPEPPRSAAGFDPLSFEPEPPSAIGAAATAGSQAPVALRFPEALGLPDEHPSALHPLPDPFEPGTQPLQPEPPCRPAAVGAARAESPQPEKEPQAPVPETVTFPAIVAAPAPPEPEEPFDPVAVILKGRELAESLDLGPVVGVEEAASVELLCFRVATEEYAIDIMEIKEIIKPREVTEVPRVPSFVRGILSLRGIIIPVFDMRLRLGLPLGVRAERERVIVVKRESGFCGILVDEVVQVVRIPAQGIEPPPVVLEGIDREFVSGIGRVAERMLILLDIGKVLDVNLG